MLRQKGHLVVLAPAHQWLYCKFDKELGHYRRYSIKKMERLLRNAEFSIFSKQHFNFTGIAGWLLLGKLLKRKMLLQGEMSTFNMLVPVASLLDKITLKKIGLSIIVTGQKK